MKLIREFLSVPFFLAAGALICTGIVIGFMASMIDGQEKK